MDLYDYIKTRYKENSKFTAKFFAKELGISNSYMLKLIKGIRKPSLDLCCSIEKYTDGLVTYADICKTHMDIFKKEKKNRDTKKQIEEEKKKEQDSAEIKKDV